MIDRHLHDLFSREKPEGGFPERPGLGFRPDSTAWAEMALLGRRGEENRLGRASQRLKEFQKADGRVCLIPGLPQAFWPTPLTILAWTGANQCLEARDRAVRFLLTVTGRHWQKKKESVTAHDTSLKGWPWIEGTHSWVEPTALSIVAMRIAGHPQHDRVLEAVEMLVDRQLPGGGWNYGNTHVFGRELRPLPETTGVALEALAGRVPLEKVRESLNYLETGLPRVPTPLSLGWSILGLSSWGRRPANADLLLHRCLENQEITGCYTTSNLSLLLLASQAQEGLGNWIIDRWQS